MNRLRAALLRVHDSGRYLMGPEVEAFEAEFAAYLGVRHCVAVSSGMAALRLGLRALGVGPGKSVMVPSKTYVGTWLAVSQVGGQIVAIDNSDDWWQSTYAAIPVYLYGLCEPNPLIPPEVKVLADCAQAHGATVGGELAGTNDDAAAFSFYPTKPLACLGDGGAIVTDLDDLTFNEDGYRLADNRMDELQAAVLRVELDYLDEDNAARQKIADRYEYAALNAGLKTDYPPDARTLQWEFIRRWSVWHQFVVYHPERDAFQQRLADAGIETMVHYRIPPHRHPLYAGQFECPNADKWAATVLSLPIYPWMPEREVEYVTRKVRELG